MWVRRITDIIYVQVKLGQVKSSLLRKIEKIQNRMYKIKVIIKNKVLSIFHANMYVSSCQSVDMRIDIVKYEEGAFKRRN